MVPRLAVLVWISVSVCSGYEVSLSRRSVMAVIGASSPLAAFAEPIRLTDEEMAARVARKQELLRRQSQGASFTSSLDVRSDVNPEAAVSLRSRSFVENAKSSLAKQEELKRRDKATKRDDLCEMLGRGC